MLFKKVGFKEWRKWRKRVRESDGWGGGGVRRRREIIEKLKMDHCTFGQTLQANYK